MKKALKRSTAYVLALVLALSAVVMTDAGSSYAKIKLNNTSKTLSVGKSFTLKVKGTKKKAKFSSSKRYVATVSKKGVVKAKSAGKTIITAKIGKKKYKCKVTVKDNTSQKDTTPGGGSGTTNTNKPSNSNTNQIANSTLAANVGIKGEVLPADRSVVVTVTNNNNVMLKYVRINYMLRDTAGKALETGYKACFAVKAKQNIMFKIDARDMNDNSRLADMSKSTFSIEVDNSLYYRAADAVTVKAEKNNDKIMLTYHNDEKEPVSTQVLICFYNDAGEMIGSRWDFAAIPAGLEFYDEIRVPSCDYSKPTIDKYGDTVYPDFTYASYKVFSYSYY